jgi:hypothetical protein
MSAEITILKAPARDRRYNAIFSHVLADAITVLPVVGSR